MEFPSEPAATVPPAPAPGFLANMAWFFSGAVLPIGSLSFYRNATRRSVGLAVLFFTVFTVFISILTTITIGVAMAAAITDIHLAYSTRRLPTVTITGGVAEVDGTQPLVLLDHPNASEPMLVAADTTGRIPEIDQRRYVQGILLTRHELHLLNTGGRYQRIPLSELNSLFGADPLIIDEQSVTNAWIALGAVVTLLALIGLVLWNTVVRLMIIAMIALVLWGIGSLFKPKVGFGPFIVTGLYAIVPAVYISHLFTRSETSFPGLQTVLLMIFWAAGLLAALSGNNFFADERPMRLWTALIGLPMVVWFIVDMFAKLPSPGAQIALWVLSTLTVVALICVRLYFRLSADGPASPATPAPPAAPLPPPA